jgi:hypothetical protein
LDLSFVIQLFPHPNLPGLAEIQAAGISDLAGWGDAIIGVRRVSTAWGMIMIHPY